MDLTEIKSAFWPDLDIQELLVLHGGLVHQSIKIVVEGATYLLQQINQDVFTNPSSTISNIQTVTDHLLADVNYDLETPSLVMTSDGARLYQDANGNFWRCMTYLPHDDAFVFKNNPATAYLVAEAFGKFAASLSTLDSSTVLDTIPRFHDPSSRLQKYDLALNQMNGHSHSKEVQALLIDIARHRFVAENFDRLSLPGYIAHNDAKPSNVLFRADGRPIAIIDLDTVMPGSPLLDFGDLARSMANPVAEDNPNISQVMFSAEIYKALKAGFVNGLNNTLTEFEIAHLSDAVGYIIFEQCLRFMTDYLLGNIYYKISYETHNLVRAGNQMRLLQSFLAQNLS